MGRKKVYASENPHFDAVRKYREAQNENGEYIRENIIDKNGNIVLDENGNPKTKPVLKIKRVPLDMPIADYEELKQFAADHGEKVNQFIKLAIAERMERIAAADPGEDSAT